MKKNVMMRVAALLLVCVLATTCGISGTFAKYTSQATGTAIAKVAKWDVKVGDATLGVATRSFTFNLFDTINDTLGGDEEDVADLHIAPGTTGSATITITNNSEVNVNYNVELAVPAALQGIVTFTASPASGNLYMTDNKPVDIVVTWTWPYEVVSPNTNEADTALGLAGAENLEFTVNVTVTQKD